MNIKFNITRSEFLNEYLEKKPLIIKSAIDSNYFNWSDVNAVIERSDIISSGFKLLSQQKVLDKTEYIESYHEVGILKHRLIKSVIYNYLQKGATLISNRIINEPKIDTLARQVAHFTQRQVLNSIYIAFGNEDSFRAHWDTRDIFAFQLMGRKKWVIYQPNFESPLHMQQSKDIEHLYPCPQEPFMEFILEAGDMLYLPRGWWHNPSPLGEETVHLSIAAFPAYAIDYLSWIYHKMPLLPEARKSLGNWEDDQYLLKALGRSLQEILESPELYQQFTDEFYSTQRRYSKLHLDQLGNPNNKLIPTKSKLYLNTNCTHGLDRGYIIANGCKINLDDFGRNIIEKIEDSPGIKYSELTTTLHDYSEEKLNDLIRELCIQDILEIELSDNDEQIKNKNYFTV